MTFAFLNYTSKRLLKNEEILLKLYLPFTALYSFHLHITPNKATFKICNVTKKIYSAASKAYCGT